jgi:hypothetical protein
MSAKYKKYAPQGHFLPMVRAQHNMHGKESLGVEPKDGIIFLTFDIKARKAMPMCRLAKMSKRFGFLH